MLRDLVVAVGKQLQEKGAEIHQLKISLLISYKASEKVLAVLQKYFKWQCDQEDTMEAIAEGVILTGGFDLLRSGHSDTAGSE